MSVPHAVVTGAIGVNLARLPTLSTLFKIGVDNALIQVPQNYTVPANPPSEPNPPDNLATPTENTQSTTTSDSVTVFVSAIKNFSAPLTMSMVIQPMTSELAAELDFTLSPLDSTIAPWLGQIGSTSTNWLSASQMTPTSDGTGTQGPLPFVLQPNLSNSLNTYVASNFKTLWINPGLTGGAINPNHPPSYLVSIFAFDPLSNTYAACNFTLVVVPSVANYGLGVYSKAQVGDDFTYINSVTLNTKVVTGTTTSASATVLTDTNLSLVVNSLTDDVLIYTTGPAIGPGNPITSNTATTITTPAFAPAPSGGGRDDFQVSEGITIYYFFYPLEPASKQTPGFGSGYPSDLNITVDFFNNPIIDQTNTTITNYDGAMAGTPIPIGSYTAADGAGAILKGFTRDTLSAVSLYNIQHGSHFLKVRLYLNDNTSAGNPIYSHALLKITATDNNGVSVSAYTAIYVAGVTTP